MPLQQFSVLKLGVKVFMMDVKVYTKPQRYILPNHLELPGLFGQKAKDHA